ncbi:MAG: glycosyltransferase [Tessaracoccus sp.]|uniref:glycosyltransferase n=1 Tax=Tessaracoccus sp. TaxID=1971211 RepID=UPI001EC4464E|nr:glycosyltransferase [Tessaracoccus sp.]MBK7820160.1 glycosyltransferase [Tessaracoccus sp.]
MSQVSSGYFSDTTRPQNRVPIVLISNETYVLPTAVAIYSVIESRKPDTEYVIYIIGSDISDSSSSLLEGLSRPNASVRVLRRSAEMIQGLHQDSADSIAAATSDALLKFYIPEILEHEDVVLYLDGDILVRDDLAELFAVDLGDNYIAAVGDSGAIYYRHKFVQAVERYFNSGVMVLNLDAWRRDNLTQRLVDRKRALVDSSLVDQNVLNLELDGRVTLLPPKFNALMVNLMRASKARKIAIEDFNAGFGVDYASFEDFFEDAAIIHYSSRDKPWKFSDTPGADDWYRTYLDAEIPLRTSRRSAKADEAPELFDSDTPRVSVIIPFYQSVDYVRDAIMSVLTQDLAELEVICVDDGSTDGGDVIVAGLAARDPRVVLLRQDNRGAAAARNLALEHATGEYILFLDSDDWLERDTLLALYADAARSDVDVLLFEGRSFFETVELEAEHPGYAKYYRYQGEYRNTVSGPELFVAMAKNWDVKDSAALRMIRRSLVQEHDLRFPEGIVREDIYFAFASTVAARLAKVVNRTSYVRRVRGGSVMTASADARHYQGLITVTGMIIDRLIDMSANNELIGASLPRLDLYLKTTQRYADALDSEERALVEAEYHLTTRHFGFLAEAAKKAFRKGEETQRFRGMASEARADAKNARAETRAVRSELRAMQEDYVRLQEKTKRQIRELKEARARDVELVRSSMSYRLGNGVVRPLSMLRRRLQANRGTRQIE